MVVIRRIDAEATALQRQGELALWPPLLGQEASQIGSARALRDDDFVFPSYRDNGVAYCRGVNLEDIVRAWRGSASAGWDPYTVNMATQQIIIGAQTLHATGYAMGIQNDGADSRRRRLLRRRRHERRRRQRGHGLRRELPGARWSSSARTTTGPSPSPSGLQSHIQLADRAAGFGIPSMRVDGNDVLAVMAATRIALDRARRGGGPTFIEAVTYRMGPHTTADDPTRYRDANELEDWAAKDPIARLKALLDRKGLLTEELEAAVAAKADAVATELRAGTHQHARPAAAGHLQARLQHAQLLARPPAGPLLPLPGFLRRSRRGHI